MKYLIKASIEVEGMVDKHDVIGALFGQTEGLLSPELDFRELQDKGRIGRIQVDIKPSNGKMRGEIKIPSNLDRAETALLAALIETVDKVGPYNAKIRVTRIVDLRLEKLKKAVERAKEILREWQATELPDVKELLRDIESSLRPSELIEYGEDKLPAGPGVDKSDELIVVEGRADVINLLRYGYDNVIAIEGARGHIPETIKKLTQKKRKVIAFTDGDHAGELILRDLIREAKVDYVARPPQGKEVEDLTGKEIEKALSNAIPVSEYLKRERRAERRPHAEKPAVEKEARAQAAREATQVETLTLDLPGEVIKEAKKLPGTLEAVIYDKEWKEVKRVPVRDLYETLKEMEPGQAMAVVSDGIITQRIVDIASEKKIPLVIGSRVGNIVKKDGNVTILTLMDLLE